MTLDGPPWGGARTPGAGVRAVMTDDLTPDHWQHIDTAEVGTTATAYLDAAAAAITAPRIRSHQLLGVEPGATVLDVGCGTGIALREIADLVGRDGTLVGLDPSAAMLEPARRASRCPGTVRTRRGHGHEHGPRERPVRCRAHRAHPHSRHPAGRGAGRARSGDSAGRARRARRARSPSARPRHRNARCVGAVHDGVRPNAPEHQRGPSCAIRRHDARAWSRVDQTDHVSVPVELAVHGGLQPRGGARGTLQRTMALRGARQWPSPPRWRYGPRVLGNAHQDSSCSPRAPSATEKGIAGCPNVAPELGSSPPRNTNRSTATGPATVWGGCPRTLGQARSHRVAEVPFRAYRTWSHNVTSEPS